MDALAKMATDLGESIALQGETIGRGYSRNPSEQFKVNMSFLLTCNSIDRGEYFHSIRHKNY